MTTEPSETWAWTEEAGFPETAYTFVYRVLREAILNGTLQGGTRLAQNGIAARLGVSTTPVREALHKLRSEGLIDSGPGRRYVVHNLSLEEWQGIVALKRLLEPYSLSLAAQRVDAQTLAALEKVHGQMTQEENTAKYVDLNREFHHICREAAGFPRLTAMLEALQDAESGYIAKGVREHPEVMAQSISDHAAIIEGLRARDAAALEKVIVRHVGLTLTPYVQD
jgi:DNA-binding GntR family transcriptional regulator